MRSKKFIYGLLAIVMAFGLVTVVRSLSSTYAIDTTDVGIFYISLHPNNGNWSNTVLESENYKNGMFVVKLSTTDASASYSLTSISTLISRSGYKLIGWTSDGEVCKTGKIEVTENATYYACWGKYKVTFDGNDGNIDGNASVTQYCAVDSNDYCYINENYIPTATRVGYKFLGWSNDGKTCTTSKITVTSDSTYYACWGKYKVTFDGNGGTPSTQSLYCAEFSDGGCYITKESLPSVSRAGYTFAGWKLYGSDTCKNETLKITGESTYVACWSESSGGSSGDLSGGSSGDSSGDSSGGSSGDSSGGSSGDTSDDENSEDLPTSDVTSGTIDDNDKMYNVVIDYYYKGTKDRVKFDNDDVNPFKVSVIDGTSGTISSPDKKGCVPDKKIVSYVVDGQDFNGVVYYTCGGKEVIDNPKTGGLFIGAVIVIAITSLAYVILYHINNVREEI